MRCCWARSPDSTSAAVRPPEPCIRRRVGFEVTLYTAPGSQKLWNGVFNETQQALSENILSTYRYPGGGMRWLTAEELAQWGAEETVLQIPIW